MVSVAMGKDHVRHWFLELVREFRLQPADRLGVDRIRDNDALIGHHKHRKVEIVLEPIYVTRHLFDVAFGFLRGYAPNQPNQNDCKSC